MRPNTVAKYVRASEAKGLIRFSSHAIASGVDPKTLSEILDHTNASFTLDTYAHVTGDMQKRAAVIVGDFIDDIVEVR